MGRRGRRGHGSASSRQMAAVAAVALLVASASLRFPAAGAATAGAGERPTAPTSYVDPFIGTDVVSSTDGQGQRGADVHPGATYPFGMVQWAPDTETGPASYLYSDTVIHGFSLTHFDGPGCKAYQDVPFEPENAAPTSSPATHASDYWAGFSHADETASPGSYTVRLQTRDRAHLSVTPRTGIGEFDFPPRAQPTLLLNVGASAGGADSPGTSVAIGSSTVTGQVKSGRFCGRSNTYTLYFAARFDQPFAGVGTWNGNTLSRGSRQESGSQIGAYVTFASGTQAVEARVGVSFVSLAGAQANLAAESDGRSFAEIRSGAHDAWTEALDRVRVSGGSAADTTVFYSALYRSMLHPNIFGDADGRYTGFDGTVHTASGYTQYSNIDAWSMRHSQFALLALLTPDVASDIVRSLLADAAEGGGGMPRWAYAGANSGVMIGDDADAAIATIYAFGARGFDADAALDAMDLGARVAGSESGGVIVRPALKAYHRLGFVPIDGIHDPEVPPHLAQGVGSFTLAYTTDDFAISRMADALGRRSMADRYARTAQGWQTLFDTRTGYLRARQADGTFPAGFDPASGAGWVEGDGAQYTWTVPYDEQGLLSAMGADAVQRLDAHFTRLNGERASLYAWMGDQPEFEVPWTYDFAQAPYRTQDVVRRITTTLYSDTPGGFPGCDDGGSTASWYVFASLGLYPAIPGVAGFAISAPAFPSATLHLGNGSTVTIDAPGASAPVRYIHGLSVGGEDHPSPWLAFDAISGGATLRFTLSDVPDTSWGAAPDERPPSFDTDQVPAYLLNNSGIVSDSNPGTGAFTSEGWSYSMEALAAAGVRFGGGATYDGQVFDWPHVAPYLSDNVAASGQVLSLPTAPAGRRLWFLGSAASGPSAGIGTIRYTDGTSVPFTLRLSDWTLGLGTQLPVPGNSIAVTTPYFVGRDGIHHSPAYLFVTSVPLDPGKRVATVELPSSADRGVLHVFAIAVQAP